MENRRHLRLGQIYKRLSPSDVQTLSINRIAKIVHESVSNLLECVSHVAPKKWSQVSSLKKEIISNYVINYIKYRQPPEEAHGIWINERIESGWTYGTSYCPMNKTDPFLVEYCALPFEERLKDGIAESLLKILIAEGLASKCI